MRMSTRPHVGAAGGMDRADMERQDQMRVRRGYVMMFLASLAIPAVHLLVVSSALERTRYSWGLMPGHVLMLKWFGQLCACGPVIVAVLFALSWRKPILNTAEVLSRVAVGFYVVAAFYGAW